MAAGPFADLRGRPAKQAVYSECLPLRPRRAGGKIPAAACRPASAGCAQRRGGRDAGPGRRQAVHRSGLFPHLHRPDAGLDQGRYAGGAPPDRRPALKADQRLHEGGAFPLPALILSF